MIDLRSDTVTKPTANMKKFMLDAQLGDDAYSEDQSVNALQNYCKELFQVEDALFVTSGMMANRLAFLSQTQPGDEVITENSYHVNFFDSAPMASIAGVVMNPVRTTDGILRDSHVRECINSKQRYNYFAQPKLVSVENSINGWAGRIFPLEALKSLSLYTREEGISMHLDGARLFNAHIKTEIPLHTYASYVDTLSVCFSKGLGAPYGSMLMGTKTIINRARRLRLWLGGGVHQVGMFAAAATYAINYNLKQLAKDHELAKMFSEQLTGIAGVKVSYKDTETNMVQFSLTNLDYNPSVFLEQCAKQGLLLFPWLPGVFRAVFHLQITKDDVNQAVRIILNTLKQLNTSIPLSDTQI